MSQLDINNDGFLHLLLPDGTSKDDVKLCDGSRHPTARAHDHLRTFDPLYSYRNLLVTTLVTFFINTCRDRIARPADFTCRGALAYGNIP
jgi:hypothetical protein